MSADRCQKCGEKFWFETDGPCGIGIVRAVHPPTPCVPRPPVVYEPDDADDGIAECQRCKKLFEKTANSHRYCSEECRDNRRQYHRAYKQAKLGSVPIPLRRKCESCGKSFDTNRLPSKTCSPKCWTARRLALQEATNQRRKERAA